MRFGQSLCCIALSCRLDSIVHHQTANAPKSVHQHANMCVRSGEGVIRLVEWLRAASIEREVGLLKALSQAPVPKKVRSEGKSHLLKQ